MRRRWRRNKALVKKTVGLVGFATLLVALLAYLEGKMDVVPLLGLCSIGTLLCWSANDGTTSGNRAERRRRKRVYRDHY